MALFLALACGSGFFLACLASDVLRKAFAQYQARYVDPSLKDLSDMFLFLERRQILLLNCAALALSAAVGIWLGGALLGALLSVLGFFAPGAAVRLHRKRRIRRFDAQLADGLLQLASALRAGLTLVQAMDQVGRDSGPPFRQELGLFVKEVKLGVPLEDALTNLAARVGSEELELMAVSAVVARQLGGNLAETFETLAATLRERFRLEGRIAALTSQGKLQGLIVSLLPAFIGLFFARTRPDLMEPMFRSAYGYVLVAAVVLLEAVGFLLIRRIVAIDP